MKIITAISMLLMISFMSYAQSERKHIRKGNEHYKKEKFENSEVSYRKALENQSESFEATFNLGDALYKQEKFEDAANEFTNIAPDETDKINLSRIHHNLGNCLLQSNKIEESIEAYKNALRKNPNDRETKYNLAFAQDKLKKQQQNKNQKNQDQENKQDQQNQDQKDQQKEEQQNQQQDKQNQQNQDQQNEKKHHQISKEDAKRLLEALENDEKKLLEKLKKNKVKSKKVKILKDW